MLSSTSDVFRKFWKDQKGAAPIEIGAAVLAAIAIAMGFIVLLDTMI